MSYVYFGFKLPHLLIKCLHLGALLTVVLKGFNHFLVILTIVAGNLFFFGLFIENLEAFELIDEDTLHYRLSLTDAVSFTP